MAEDTAKDVIVGGDERRPILYDMKDRPLIRETGFRAEKKEQERDA